MIGGRIFKHSIVTLGTTSAEVSLRVRADTYVMGVTGLHPETGATTGDGEEAAIKRLIAQQSAETIVLTTREKLATASPYSIMPLSEIATLVTEAGLTEDMLQPFRTAGVNVVEG